LLNSDKILKNIVIQSIAKNVNCANSSDDTGYCLAIANRSKQLFKDFTIDSIYYQLAVQPTIDEKAANILKKAESTTK